MSVYRLLERVASALRPTDEVFETLEHVLDTVNHQLSLRELDARAVAGGSVAKGTFLRGSHDVDVFVRFSSRYADEDLPDLLAPALKRFRPQRVHGSRDYFMFDFRGYTFELVPVLSIDDPSQARNVTDVSPLHVAYFTAHGEGLEDDVRLAKQFCKACGVYGAESYIRGFSGHVIDLLIIDYGSFYDLAKAAARWQPPVVIDREEHHSNPLVAIDRAKHAPIVLVDPMQPLRNAAAALDREQFDVFVERCRRFLEEPSVEFFKVPEFNEQELLARLEEEDGASVVLHVAHDADDKRDVAGARVRKFFERLRDEFSRAGFSVRESGWEFLFGGESVLWYVLGPEQLPASYEREGPPVGEEEHAARFSEEHGDVEERDGRLYAVVDRKIRTPVQVLDSVAQEAAEQAGVSFSVVARGT